MVYLTPGAAQRDPYDEEYADIEDRFLDFKGDLIHHPHSSARKQLAREVIPRCSSL